MSFIEAVKQVKGLERRIRTLSWSQKNAVLEALRSELRARSEAILAANAEDVAASQADQKPKAFIDRLLLDENRLAAIDESLRQIVALADPVGERVETRKLANGIDVKRVRAPLGVLLIIFESRPNVAIDAFALALKSGNSVILRGGKEASRTLTVFYEAIRSALKKGASVDAKAFHGIVDSDRDSLKALLAERSLIDIVIPRGGDALIEFVVEHSRIPIIKNDRGLCHLYIHEDADLAMAREILINAKTQRPGVCNAIETLLIHEKAAKAMLPDLYRALASQGVEWFCCPKAYARLSSVQVAQSKVSFTNSKSYDTEYLDLKLNCRQVNSLEEAIEHIEKHGSRHSEAIVTSNPEVGEFFQREVDAAAVYVNASTRFTDGFELGLGGEIGISTQKLHVRGPVGLRELTSVRWVMTGNGQVRM